MAFLAVLLSLTACAGPAGQCPDVPENAFTLDLEDSYYGSLSEESDQALYRKIEECASLALSGNQSFLDTGSDILSEEQRLKDIAHMVLYDHPEWGAFWSTCSMQVLNRSSLRILPAGTPDDMVDDGTYEKQFASLTGPDDLSTAWNVFSWLSESFSYDQSKGPHANDDSGIMREGRACCQGASFAYKRFMDAAGIPCVAVTSMTDTGTYHMVPFIRLFGRWYACDVSNAMGKAPERFFLMDAEQAEHIFYKIVYAPQKTGKK